MARRKISTTVYLGAEQLDQLKLLSERTGDSVARYVREGIDLVLKQYASLLPQPELPLDRPRPNRVPSRKLP